MTDSVPTPTALDSPPEPTTTPEPPPEDPAPDQEAAAPAWARWASAIGFDWAAVILVGIVTLLAVTDALPKIPW